MAGAETGQGSLGVIAALPTNLSSLEVEPHLCSSTQASGSAVGGGPHDSRCCSGYQEYKLECSEYSSPSMVHPTPGAVLVLAETCGASQAPRGHTDRRGVGAVHVDRLTLNLSPCADAAAPLLQKQRLASFSAASGGAGSSRWWRRPRHYIPVIVGERDCVTGVHETAPLLG